MTRQTYIPRDEYLAETPAPTQSAGPELSRLEAALRDFNQYYERITDVRYGAAIARLKNLKLYTEYGQALADAETMKRRIEAALGAWDTVKGWVGLGALPLIPIAVALGLTAAIAASVTAGRSFMRSADIALAIRQDPELSYEQAADQVDRANQGSFGRALDLAQWGLGAFVLFTVFKYLRG